MPDDTKKDVAASADSVSDLSSSDDLLSQAASDAVNKQQKEEIFEEQDNEPAELSKEQDEPEELDDDGLPKDNAKRSDLGRKITAFHRRQDEFEERINKLLELAESQSTRFTNAPPKEEEVNFDPNEPITFAEMNKILDYREKASKQQNEYYNNQYLRTLGSLSSDLSEQEQGQILEEMKNITYKPSNDPARDAELNFYKAEKAFLRKQLATAKTGKKIPLRGDEPLDGIPNQKNVARDVPLPKLSPSAQSYLAYIARTDGQEKAVALHKELAKK